MSRKRGTIETPEYGRMVVRIIRAYAKRVTHADEPDLAQMLAVRDEMDKAIVAAIHGQRAVYARSWNDIAAATGTTRQAAQQRWGKKVAELDIELNTADTSTHYNPDGSIATIERHDADGNVLNGTYLPELLAAGVAR